MIGVRRRGSTVVLGLEGRTRTVQCENVHVARQLVEFGLPEVVLRGHALEDLGAAALAAFAVVDAMRWQAERRVRGARQRRW